MASCVKFGTHYCDITGEVNWVKKLITGYEEEAKKSGAIIVNCCGMDCIPSDLGTFAITSHIKEKYNAKCKNVKAFVSSLFT